jgi:hypothetical protein
MSWRRRMISRLPNDPLPQAGPIADNARRVIAALAWLTARQPDASTRQASPPTVEEAGVLC